MNRWKYLIINCLPINEFINENQRNLYLKRVRLKKKKRVRLVFLLTLDGETSSCFMLWFLMTPVYTEDLYFIMIPERMKARTVTISSVNSNQTWINHIVSKYS